MAIKPKPVATSFSAFFWDGAREERLLIQRCATCRRYNHPPGPICPACGSRDLAPEQVSGAGEVHAFTIVRRVFHPGFAGDVPYVLARIALAEQPDLYLIANIIGCPVDAVHGGMPVRVAFEHRGDHSLPQFTSTGAERAR